MMTTLKERQFQVRESAIVETMYQLLVQKGYAATSMDDVAEQVGISKPTLYLHFKSKTELTLKVVIQQIEQTEAGIQSLDRSLPAVERIKRNLYDAIKRRATMGTAQIELLPRELYSDPAYQAAVRKLADAARALIEEGQRQGDVRTDLSAGLIQAFIATIFDMDFGRLAQAGPSVEVLCEQIFDLMLRAIRP